MYSTPAALFHAHAWTPRQVGQYLNIADSCSGDRWRRHTLAAVFLWLGLHIGLWGNSTVSLVMMKGNKHYHCSHSITTGDDIKICSMLYVILYMVPSC